MNGTFIWWVFCGPPPIRMLLLCTVFSTRLCVLSHQYQPFSSQATCFLHVQGDGFPQGQVFAKGERSKRVFIQYNHAQLLDMTPARLTPDLISHLRSLQIGTDLLRKWSRHGGRRKQKQSKQGDHLPPSSLSLTEWLISNDQDLVEDSRSDIPVRITSHVNHTPTIRQCSVNFSNLISITTQDSHESTHQSQSCIKVLCFNLQSCQQIATDIHMIIDTNADVLMSMETWLYSHGDKAYIAAMTPAGYDFRSFPHVGSRGGGISFVTRTSLSTSLSFKPLDYSSFKAVEMQLSFDRVSVAIVCLYQPPPSKRNKLTNSMFLEEFLELLSQYADSHSDTVYIGDFNFHYDDCSDGQVSCLRTMLSDHNLTQLVNVPTHQRGHILDWVVVPTENGCFCFDSVQDYPDLSDHKAVICTLAVMKPSPHRRLVMYVSSTSSTTWGPGLRLPVSSVLTSIWKALGFVKFLTAMPCPSPDTWETALPPLGWPRRSGRLNGDRDWRSNGGERPVSQSTIYVHSGLLWKHVFRRPRDRSTVRRSIPVLPAGSSSLCPANCWANPAPPLSHQTSPVPICLISFVTRAHVSHQPLPFLMVHSSLSLIWWPRN